MERNEAGVMGRKRRKEAIGEMVASVVETGQLEGIEDRLVGMLVVAVVRDEASEGGLRVRKGCLAWNGMDGVRLVAMEVEDVLARTAQSIQAAHEGAREAAVRGKKGARVQ